MKTIPLEKQKRGLADKLDQWFHVIKAPPVYHSNWSGKNHLVRYAETRTNNEGKPWWVSVRFWCGGMGTVSPGPALDSKGQWLDHMPGLQVCPRCASAAKASAARREKTKAPKP